MGHQVNIYVDPSDTISLAHALRGLGPLHLLHSRSPTSEPKVIESVNVEENGQPWLFLYLVRPEDLGAVVTRHVPAQGYWTVDVLKSPVVEFNRCFFDGRILRRGRLYYIDGFYGANEQWTEKPEAFRQWARAILTKTKSTLNKHKGDYIGTGAEAWLALGKGKLVM